MGKYNYKDHVESHENEPKTYFLFCILNELAERNRLKRLELDCKYTLNHINDKGKNKICIISISKEELEDHA